MLFLSRPAHRFRSLATTIALVPLIWAAGDLPQSIADTTTALGQVLSKRAAALAHSHGAERVDVIVVYKQRPGKAENDRIQALEGETQRAFGRLNMR